VWRTKDVGESRVNSLPHLKRIFYHKINVFTHLLMGLASSGYEPSLRQLRENNWTEFHCKCDVSIDTTIE
jgi:hypothetical protein